MDANLNENRKPLNVAVVGGGKTCKFFLEQLQQDLLPYLHINIVGVCDINQDAEGLLLAREMNIYTTDNYKDLFKIQDLDGILELTNNRDVLLELINLRPRRVGIIEHNIGQLMKSLFQVHQKLKQVEHQVVLEKMISDFVIHQVNEKVVVLSPDFTVINANDSYLKTLNKTREEVIDSKCYEITFGLGVPCASSQIGIECPMVETLKTGQSSHVIFEHPSEDGHLMYSDLITYPVKNTHGKILQIVEIWRDITKELAPTWERRMERMKSDINKLVQEDRMISLGKLVASCVHEINNPIQGLLTFSYLIKDTLEEGVPSVETLGEIQKHIEIMCKELDRCGQIVSGLLSFSRDISKTFLPTDLNEVIRSTITLTHHKMKLQNIDLTVDLCKAPLIVYGASGRLEQCFLNLVFNAIEAMPDGGVLSIESRQEKEGHQAIVRIRDQGYGIPEGQLGNIFDPFFTTKEAGEGTGLGLSIVYGVVKNHGGNINVESKPKNGCCFELAFPIYKPSSGIPDGKPGAGGCQ